MPSPKRTILLATVLTAATVGVAYTISTAGNGGDPNFSGCPRREGYADSGIVRSGSERRRAA